jgi:hypothetical protein
MTENGSPIASALLTGAFVCAMAAAAAAIAIDNATIGGVLFVCCFAVSLGLLVSGLVVAWRNRKKQYEFAEPTGALPRFLLRMFRLVAGVFLTTSGCIMLIVSSVRVIRGEGLPVMGCLMGATLVGFGFKGLVAGLKKAPNQ